MENDFNDRAFKERMAKAEKRTLADEGGDCNHCQDIRAKLVRQKVALKQREACDTRRKRRIRDLEAEIERLRGRFDEITDELADQEREFAAAADRAADREKYNSDGWEEADLECERLRFALAYLAESTMEAEHMKKYARRALDPTATDTNTEQLEVCGGSGNLSERDKATINEHMEKLRADTNTEDES